MEQQQLPIDLWIGLVAYNGPEISGRQSIGIATRGLRTFLGREIEFRPAALSLGEVAGRVVSIIAYLLQAGPVFKDGDTLGLTEKERIRINFRDETSRPGVPVWELVFETGNSVAAG